MTEPTDPGVPINPVPYVPPTQPLPVPQPPYPPPGYYYPPQSPGPSLENKVARGTMTVILTVVGIFCGIPLVLCLGWLAVAGIANLFSR